METTRREFLKESLAALGFLALPGGWLFAAPPGWKPKGMPNLVFGVISDTHLRTAVKGNGHGAHWPDKYLVAALEYFKEQNVDAIVHCGDMAHRGQTREMEFHAEAWRKVFVKSGEPVKLFVTGNHDANGATYGDFVEKRYPDPVERAKHVLATDMAANWERIWGEKYEPVWHKEVKGYHFFGRHWNVDYKDFAGLVNSSAAQCRLGEGTRPFFVLQHRRPYAELRKALSSHGNAVSFFGHNHWSASNWNVISLDKGNLPVVQVPSCEPRGCAALADCKEIAQMKPIKTERTGKGRQGYVVRVYDDMLVIERREFTDGVSSLGADWVMPLGKFNPHPFSKEELKRAIGEPQFRRGAKLTVEISNAETQRRREGENENSAFPRLCVKIPLADGNPDSRVYAYEVVVIGDEGTQRLFKAVYAAGVNLGMGHEPNGGVTMLDIPMSELPPGKTLTIAARPLSSLGTSGKAIVAEWRIGKDASE